MLSHVLRKARPQSARIQQISRSLASLPWETSVSHDIATPERSNKNPVPSFNDTQSAYESKSNFELVRAAACFTISRIPILITYSEVMLRAARYISPSVTDALMRVTFYGHFCAGEDQVRIQPVIKMLDNFGVGNILDYAAESDEPSTPTPKSTPSAAPNHNQLSSELSTPVAREYDYESEAKCDQHVDVFMQCINDVASGSKDGYAAIKVTALGNPKLLTRMSQAITEAKRLFEKFDDNMDGYVTREEFELSFKKYFHVDDDDDTSINKIFEEYDPDHTGKIDYIMWSMMLDLKDLPKITAACKDVGPLAMAAPTDEEIELIEAMYTRGHVLANEAARVGTRLLIDAEQVRYQPAIDKLVFDLQRTYNTVGEVDKPIVYNTYQCYLKDVSERLDVDVKRAERFGYHFGAKLVRGAYMESENELAKKQGIPSPIHDSIEDTHKSYDDSVDQLLLHSTTSDKQVEVMCATHNQSSIEKAIESMNLHNIDRKSSTICFAQLYGMSDHLSFNLGKHGYRAYKYLPYGEVAEVMPYLLRRANENSAILGATASELDMIQSELKRRIQTKLKMNS